VTGAPTANALVRVVSVDNPGVMDGSDLAFSILQPTLALLSPNGGDTLVAGSPAMLQWASTNLTGNVRIELSRNGGTSWPALFTSTPDDGSEPWTPTGPATTQAMIRIKSIDVPALLDVSDSVFTIVQPSLAVLTPNGGELWAVGSTQALQWSSQFVPGNVRIELSRDGGLTYPEVLFADTANDGTEAWAVTGPQSVTARIRVVSINDTTLKSTSAANFSILQPAIALITPAGGEDWQVDSVRTFQWSSQVVSGDVSIELSRDAGATYAMVLPVTANDGQEDWTVTGPLTTHARVRVRSLEDSTVLAVSAGDFVISRPATAVHTTTDGWNMLSVPVTVADLLTPQVFPAAVSPAYTFGASGYLVHDTLRYGSGYWLKFNGAQGINVVGSVRPTDTIDVSAGWNMIGSVSGPVQVDSIVQIPGGIVTTSFYEFTGTAYAPTDSIKAMRAYWVKAGAPGRLVLTMPAGTFTAAPPGAASPVRKQTQKNTR
jgi:hypothetical protein